MAKLPRAIEVFLRLHEGLPKQAPGSDASTRQALGMLQGLPSTPRVLDLGCGPGRQTLVLAEETGGRVVAVDRDETFLTDLERRARERGVADRVETSNQSMDALDLAPESFDLLWAEGSAYAIGFANALEIWRPLLVAGGGLALTELSWLDGTPPQEAAAFWQSAYPDMRDRARSRELVQRAGYSLLGDFVLPASDWWDDYYAPLRERIPALRLEYENDRDAEAVLGECEREIEAFERFGDSYGYVFYVARKTRD
jgi:SAM-dependent methyltransferase